jgi:hypothetical protein
MVQNIVYLRVWPWNLKEKCAFFVFSIVFYNINEILFISGIAEFCCIFFFNLKIYFNQLQNETLNGVREFGFSSFQPKSILASSHIGRARPLVSPAPGDPAVTCSSCPSGGTHASVGTAEPWQPC